MLVEPGVLHGYDGLYKVLRDLVEGHRDPALDEERPEGGAVGRDEVGHSAWLITEERLHLRQVLCKREREPKDPADKNREDQGKGIPERRAGEFQRFPYL